MAIQTEIHYEGRTYFGKALGGGQLAELKDNLYGVINQMEKIELELEDGGYLLMRKECLQKAIIILREV